MSSPLDLLSPSEIGERLRIARDNVGLTQADAAAEMQFARTTLVAIEQGQRRVRLSELQKLAQLYKTSINGLFREEAVHVDLEPRFRRHTSSTYNASQAAVQLLSDLAKAEVELENLLGVKRMRNYPPERPIQPGDVRLQAEQDAIEFRERLGLGFRPIGDIVTLLELEMGVRVYVRRVDSRVCGLFAYDEALGACILLNANHPRERRTQTAAHEAGHMLSNRSDPDVLHLNETENSREERYANAFGRALLTPVRAVRQKFQEVTAGSDRLTRRHVIVLAYFFGVSREAMVRRLEELGLTKAGTWDWFQANGGISDEQARQILGDSRPADAYKADADRPTSLRLNLLAAEAYRRELLSEGQLSRLLHLDRVDLRDILDGQDVEGDAALGAPNLFG